MVKEKEYYNLSSDIVFKFIFGYKKNKHYTEWLLENLFHLKPGSLKNKLEIKNSLNLDKSAFNTHGLELDIEVKMPDGTFVNLEMYAQDFGEYEQKKSYAYLTTLFGSQLPIGSDFKDMQKCLQINFIRDKKYLKGKYKLLDEEKEYHPKGIELDVVNIDRPEMSCYDINEELRKCFQLMNAKSIEEAREIAKGSEVLENMARDIEKFNLDEWRRDYFSVGREWERKVQAGINEGLEQGEKKKAIETTSNLLKLGTVSIKDIAKVTGLSLNDVKAIDKKINC